MQNFSLIPNPKTNLKKRIFFIKKNIFAKEMEERERGGGGLANIWNWFNSVYQKHLIEPSSHRREIQQIPQVCSRKKRCIFNNFKKGLYIYI